MDKYLMFGFLPIRVSPEGTWTADTGSRLVDQIANTGARMALLFIDSLERAFDVHLPVSVVPAQELPATQM